MQFLAALAILPRTIFKNMMNSHFSFNHPGAVHPIIQNRSRQNSQRGKEFNKFFPPKRRPISLYAFSSVFILLLCE